MIDKRTKHALNNLRREIRALSEEIQHRRELKALAVKRAKNERNQRQDDAAFALMIEYDMVPDFD